MSMSSSESVSHLRRVRSFVRREGRLTPGQRRAFELSWPRFGLEVDNEPWNLDEIFGRCAPRVLEIGFGNGESLCEMAMQAPETDFIGIEVYRPGIGHLLQRMEAECLRNVRVVCHDAIEVLQHCIAAASLDRVQLYFPDPWPKKRHHKRRIVQPEFVALVARGLKKGGMLHMATDWEDYAQHMMAVLSAAPGFANAAGSGRFAERPEVRPLTKFERRGHRLGHGVWDLLFVSIGDAPAPAIE